ncbi:MAG: hypothetical protein Q9170_004580 [Blastenia crenularia]
MAILYFASPFGQTHSRHGHGFPHPGKRKRAADEAEKPTVSEQDSDESIYSDESGVQAQATSRSSSGAGLRQQHYSVVTSLLHRCILEKDYQRASRAWGMMLRMEVHGHPLDIRAQDRWGIGAELLLHSETNVSISTIPQDPRALQKGLMKAKDYYERLILQFPYRKIAPDSISSLTFYPVMFGIWIHSIQLRHKIAMQDTLPSDSAELDNANDSDDQSLPSRIVAQMEGQLTVYHTVIRDANEVIDRLVELLSSPPYSDHAGLWKTQGMLYLWVSQLSDHATTLLTQPNSSDDDPAPIVNRNSQPVGESTISLQDQRYSEENRGDRQRTIHKAREAFSRALALGDTLDSRTMQAVGF